MSSTGSSRIAISTACSPTIGFGHLRRCLTLAGALAERGAIPELFVRGGGGLNQVAAAGLVARELTDDGDLAIFGRAACVLVDDYGASEERLARLSQLAPLVVVDDLADRHLSARLVVNACANAATLAYRTSPGCRLLLGPRYALLRRGFRAVEPRPVEPLPRRVLVTLGGSDPQRRTRAIVESLAAALPEATLDVVIGPLADVPDLSREGKIVCHQAPDDLAPLMRRADLAVSAGGQTTYELAACGVPTIAVCVADNQRASLRALAEVPTLLLADEDVAGAVVRLARDLELRRAMSARGPSLIDGLGADRVAGEIMSLVEGAEGATPR